MKADAPDRPIIALTRVPMQMAPGAVYAGSVFRIPLSQATAGPFPG
jgi:hypothetical protein